MKEWFNNLIMGFLGWIWGVITWPFVKVFQWFAFNHVAAFKSLPWAFALAVLVATLMFLWALYWMGRDLISQLLPRRSPALEMAQGVPRAHLREALRQSFQSVGWVPAPGKEFTFIPGGMNQVSLSHALSFPWRMARATAAQTTFWIVAAAWMVLHYTSFPLLSVVVASFFWFVVEVIRTPSELERKKGKEKPPTLPAHLFVLVLTGFWVPVAVMAYSLAVWAWACLRLVRPVPPSSITVEFDSPNTPGFILAYRGLESRKLVPITAATTRLVAQERQTQPPEPQATTA